MGADRWTYSNDIGDYLSSFEGAGRGEKEKFLDGILTVFVSSVTSSRDSSSVELHPW